MTEVRYVDLGFPWNEERKELLQIFEDVMSTGEFIGGHYVEAFERQLEEYTGAKHAVALNSGTDALIFAMRALGIGIGDEVITPPNSFVGSTAAIVHAQATPVFADVLPDQTIDPDRIRAAISSKTKAIMPVHLTGRMARMDEIKAIADEYGIAIIEDSAQAIGSGYKSVMSGRYGEIGCFSAHPLKNLSACGDGGFIITDNSAAADAIRLMRSHGMSDRNTVLSFGFVSRMDALQAAILSYRIGRLDEVIVKRRANAMIYSKLLNPEFIFAPVDTEDYFNTYHTYVIQVDHREKLIEYLKSKKIQTAIHYPVPIHTQPAAKFLGYAKGSMPVTEKQASRILTLPINQSLNNEQVRYVAEHVNKFFETRQHEA